MNYLNLLLKNCYSLVVKRGYKIIFTSKKSGLCPLIEAANKGFLKNSLVIDKTTGLAAAKICYWHHVSKIISLTVSVKAVEFLKNHPVGFRSKNIVKEIINKKGEVCRMEKLAEQTKSYLDLVKKISQEKETLIEEAPKNGVFPDRYYTTTNYATKIKINNRWLNVNKIKMDSGIRISKAKRSAACVNSNEVKRGDLIVVGQQGIKVNPIRTSYKNNDFVFMGNNLSSERQKFFMIKFLAKHLRNIKKRDGKILFVAGPAVIHTGAGKSFESIVAKGYVDLFFSGNGFAVHDLEQNIFRTALGVEEGSGRLVNDGHHHHLWIINRIRMAGSLKKAIEKKVVTGGVMYQLVKNNIPFVLAGSIRDDGPLPEVITNAVKAQQLMRRHINQRVNIAVMCASTLHSVAVGNLLPDNVFKVVVDINPASVIKLIDRGTTNSLGIITDVEYFFYQLNKML